MSQKCVVPFKIVVRACNQLGDDLFFCNLAALDSCLNICSHVLNILHHGEWGRLGLSGTVLGPSGTFCHVTTGDRTQLVFYKRN